MAGREGGRDEDRQGDGRSRRTPRQAGGRRSDAPPEVPPDVPLDVPPEPTEERAGEDAGPARRWPSVVRGLSRTRARAGRAQRLLGPASTRRAAVLALVVCTVVLSVAVPLRNYLAQRGELGDTVQQQENLREQVDGLEQRKAELSDPAQVEAEARRRLRYVRPGETPYVVQLPSQTPAPPATDSPRADSGGSSGGMEDPVAAGGGP